MMNFYNELPEGYVEAKVIDAKKKSTAFWFTFLSFVILVAVLVVIFLIKPVKIDEILNSDNYGIKLINLVAFMISMFLYIVLHELTHGLFYKIFTKSKLTYGFTLTVAFCGVPNLYVNKKTSLITTLAPLVVFTVVLLPFVILVKSPLTYALISFLFAMHISGCIGDMYVALLLIFKFDKNTIVNDTGPKQTFYIPKNENE